MTWSRLSWLLVVVLALGLVGAVPATSAAPSSRWRQVVEVGDDAYAEACRVERRDGGFTIRSRYVVTASSDYQARFMTWARPGRKRRSLDSTAWLDPGATGALKAVTFERQARDKFAVWAIRLYARDVGWISYAYRRTQLPRC